MAADEKTLERVRAFIARTAPASGDDEEAYTPERDTCARLACKQIREFGIVLVADDAVESFSAPEMRALKIQVEQQQALINKLRNELHVRAMVTAPPRMASSAPTKRGPIQKAPPPSPPVGSPGSRFQRMGEVIGEKPARAAAKAKATEGFYDERKIKAKYPSKCRACEGDIDEGDDVIWTPGEGVQCLDCGER